MLLSMLVTDLLATSKNTKWWINAELTKRFFQRHKEILEQRESKVGRL